MKSIATFFLCLAIAFCVGGSFLVPPSYAQAPQAWNNRCAKTVTVSRTNNSLFYGQAETFNDIASIQGFECIFYNILQVIVLFAGLAFLFMFISGGFKYLFSSNEQKSVAAASATLTMAIIGLIGVIASWLILSFIQKFTGINVTNFIIPG